MSPRFRKKPVEIEAFCLTADNRNEVMKWMVGLGCSEVYSTTDDKVHIPTLEGQMTASPGDWIIRGVKGELYPCKPDIFDATYEPVEDPS